MKVSVDWAFKKDSTMFTFYTEETDGMVTIHKAVAFSKEETALLRQVFEECPQEVLGL